MNILTAIFFFILLAFSPPITYAETQKESGKAANLAHPDVIVSPDNRAKILREFLESYESPLASSADIFVKASDEQKIDWKLVAAISGVESTFGKACVGIYNCWGWGVYGDNAVYFSSYEEAIKTISKGLKENYIEKWGTKDVYQIGNYYAASPTWASRVEYFMNKIDEFAVNNQKHSLSISL